MSEAPAFTHTDAGTPEPVWLGAPEWDAVPELDAARLFAGRTRLVVASAHPDDETLGAALLLQAAGAAGLDVVLLVATSGEGSHPHSRTWSPELLAEVRRDELATAMRLLGDVRIVSLGLPDSGLAAHADRVEAELAALCDGSTVLAAPWSRDGHTDHDALGAAAERVAARCGATLLEYPIWAWHWGTPADLPWEQAATLSAPPAALAAKERALAAHRSQVEPLGPLPGDEPVVGADVTRRALRLAETYLLPVPGARDALAAAPDATDPEPFDEMYEDGPDPWGFAGSFYEARKRDLTLAMVRRERYGRALEIGTADGLLAAALAERCDALTGLDVSARAVEAARARGLAGATFVRGAAPEAVPAGPYDLVVLSEVGYFLTARQLGATLRRVRAALAPGGEIVLVDWRHPTEGIPLDGPLVHRAARAQLDLPVTAEYADADVLIDVFGGPVAIAERP